MKQLNIVKLHFLVFFYFLFFCSLYFLCLIYEVFVKPKVIDSLYSFGCFIL